MATVEVNERYSRTSQTFIKTVAPNGSESIAHYGEAFYIVTSNGELQVKTDFSPFKPYRKGTGENFPSDQRFTRLELRNDSANEITCVIWAGFGQYIDSTAEVVEAKTEAIGQPVYTINALSSVILTGNPVGNQIQRKSVVVSNLDNTNSLVLLDADNVRICNVFPESSIMLPISGQVTVLNPSATNIGCYISEIFYVI